MTTTTQSQNSTDWNTAPLTDLVDHIVNTHHVYLREQLPNLQATFERLLAKKPDDLCGFVPSLAKTFFALKDELDAHLLKEEQILFPHIRRLAEARASGAAAPAFHCGSVAGPIHQMEHEHANGKRALEELRRIAGGYKLTDDMCENR
ncbi:MAG: iron-sulfur cluster repair di-iron protein, partial [bacterium]|nr:iron-sulfur cluster repair di-iron protein [bacterium]